MKQCIVYKHKNPDSADVCTECKSPLGYPFTVNDNHFESWKDIVVNPYCLQYQIHQLQTELTNIQDKAGRIPQSEDFSTLLKVLVDSRNNRNNDQVAKKVPSKLNNFDLSALLKKNYKDMTPAELKFVVSHGHAKDVLRPFDEIQITLADGREVTAICVNITDNTVRFIIRTVLDEHVMNHKPTKETGYRDSDMRRHVLNDILPLFPQEWRDIMNPRKLKEVIQCETVEYEDKLWLLSATDVFGLCPKSLIYRVFIANWTDVDDSYQLPIFKDRKNRIFTFEGKPCDVWLRSVHYDDSNFFCEIGTDGTAYVDYAYTSWGLTAGFDI